MTSRAAEARVTPAQELDKKREDAVQQAKRRRLISDLNETFSSAAGRNSLRFLMELCGYQKPDTVADPASGEIMMRSTLYNQGRRNLYLTLRKHLRAETLIAVEIKEDAESIFE